MGPTPSIPNIPNLTLNLVSNTLCSLLHLVRPTTDDHDQNPHSTFSSSCRIPEQPRSRKIRINSMSRQERDPGTGRDNVPSSEHSGIILLPTNTIMGIGRLNSPMKRAFDSSSTSSTSHLQLLVARDTQSSQFTTTIVVTIVVTFVATVAIILLLLFVFCRRSAPPALSRSRRDCSPLWSLLCFWRRPSRVRPRDRMSSWSIDDNEALTESPFRDHRTYNYSNDGLGRYSDISLPRPRSTATLIWWKVVDGLQLLNPFKRRPVAVKSSKHKRSFLIVESNRQPPPPPLQNLDHATHRRLDSQATLNDTQYASTGTAPLSTSSSSPFASTSSWKTTWKNPFSSGSPSVMSLFPLSSRRSNEQQASPAANARVHDDDYVDLSHQYNSPRPYADSSRQNLSPRPYTDPYHQQSSPRPYADSSRQYPSPRPFGQGNLQDVSTPPPERDGSVILISRTPGVDFSISRTTLGTIAVIPPSDTACSSTHPHLQPHHSPSPSTSLSSLELCPSPVLTSPEDSPTQSPQILPTPSYDRFAGSPITENPALPGPEQFPPPHDASRFIHTNAALLYPAAVSYVELSDRYYNHNRSHSSSNDMLR